MHGHCSTGLVYLQCSIRSTTDGNAVKKFDTISFLQFSRMKSATRPCHTCIYDELENTLPPDMAVTRVVSRGEPETFCAKS